MQSNSEILTAENWAVGISIAPPSYTCMGFHLVFPSVFPFPFIVCSPRGSRQDPFSTWTRLHFAFAPSLKERPDSLRLNVKSLPEMKRCYLVGLWPPLSIHLPPCSRAWGPAFRAPSPHATAPGFSISCLLCLECSLDDCKTSPLTLHLCSSITSL